jgi:hypothetical protein
MWYWCAVLELLSKIMCVLDFLYNNKSNNSKSLHWYESWICNKWLTCVIAEIYILHVCLYKQNQHKIQVVSFVTAVNAKYWINHSFVARHIKSPKWVLLQTNIKSMKRNRDRDQCPLQKLPEHFAIMPF